MEFPGIHFAQEIVIKLYDNSVKEKSVFMEKIREEFMLTYKKLTIEETREIYDQYMTADFPPMELKPFENISDLIMKGYYSSYGFYEEEALRGYAFLCDNEDHTYSLLDYYAILSDCRGKGYGKKILAVLREIYKDYEAIILESENPQYAKNEPDFKVRTGRLSFYQKSGVIFENLESKVFGVDYVILVFPCKSNPDSSVIRRKLIDIYHILVKEPYFTANVHIY